MWDKLFKTSKEKSRKTPKKICNNNTTKRQKLRRTTLIKWTNIGCPQDKRYCLRSK
jgi:hypothetical protein